MNQQSLRVDGVHGELRCVHKERLHRVSSGGAHHGRPCPRSVTMGDATEGERERTIGGTREKRREEGGDTRRGSHRQGGSSGGRRPSHRQGEQEAKGEDPVYLFVCSESHGMRVARFGGFF
jgi:hypothetical protein